MAAPAAPVRRLPPSGRWRGLPAQRRRTAQPRRPLLRAFAAHDNRRAGGPSVDGGGALTVPVRRLTQVLSLFGRTAPPFLVPAKTASATARSHRQGRPSGRRGTRLALDGGEHGRTLFNPGIWAGTPRARRATVSLF